MLWNLLIILEGGCWSYFQQWINEDLVMQSESLAAVKRTVLFLGVTWPLCVFTSLCISVISLAKLVSAVSGRVAYRLLETSFIPLSLYLTWKMTAVVSRAHQTLSSRSLGGLFKQEIYLPEQLSSFFSVLRVHGCRQGGVQTWVHLFLTCLLVLDLGKTITQRRWPWLPLLALMM